MPDKLTLRVVTPEKVALEESGVDSVVLPAFEGEYGVLPSHAPAMLQLGAGLLRVRRGDETTPLAVSSGFAEVRDDVVSVFAETAESETEIDEERAKQALEKAKAEKHRPSGSIDLNEAEAAIKRALVRLKVAQLGRRRRPKA